jgi:hypothetical protein
MGILCYEEWLVIDIGFSHMALLREGDGSPKI